MATSAKKTVAKATGHVFTASKILIDGQICTNMGIEVTTVGRIGRVDQLAKLPKASVMLQNRLLIPGLVNTQGNVLGRLTADLPLFDVGAWVAEHLSPADVYWLARLAFVEMLQAGITLVGILHDLHNKPNNTPYSQPTAMADAYLHAARDVGIRLSLLDHVALKPNAKFSPVNERGLARSFDAACDRFDALVEHIISYRQNNFAWGIAGSIEHVPMDAWIGLKTRLAHMPMLIKLGPQPAFFAPSSTSLVEQLVKAQICDSCTTLVYTANATMQPQDASLLKQVGSLMCVQPSLLSQQPTGQHLARAWSHQQVPLSIGLGADTQASILQESGMMYLHRHNHEDTLPTLAPTLLAQASLHGATALGLQTGRIAPGFWADFITYDLSHPVFAGVNDDSQLVCALLSQDCRAALCDVVVGGKPLFAEGQHPLWQQTATAYKQWLKRLLANKPAQA